MLKGKQILAMVVTAVLMMAVMPVFPAFAAEGDSVETVYPYKDGLTVSKEAGVAIGIRIQLADGTYVGANAGKAGFTQKKATVEFYNGETLIGTMENVYPNANLLDGTTNPATKSVFCYIWDAPVGGPYTVTAKAYDLTDPESPVLIGTSEARTVTVKQFQEETGAYTEGFDGDTLSLTEDPALADVAAAAEKTYQLTDSAGNFTFDIGSHNADTQLTAVTLKDTAALSNTAPEQAPAPGKSLGILRQSELGVTESRGPSTPAKLTLNHTIPAGKIIAFDLKYYYPTTEQIEQVVTPGTFTIFQLKSGSGTVGALTMDASGNICINGSRTGSTAKVHGKWYSVRVVMDMVQRYSDIYLDGELIGGQIPFKDSWDMSGFDTNGVEEINITSAYKKQEGYNASQEKGPRTGIYLDDIRIATLVIDNSAPVNTAPVVASLTANGASDSLTVEEGTEVTFQAAATDADGNLASITLYDGENQLTTSATSPLTFATSTLSAGPHTIKVVAVDSEGMSAEKTMTVTVNGAAEPVFAVQEVNFVEEGGNATATVTFLNTTGEAKDAVVLVGLYQNDVLVKVAVSAGGSVASGALPSDVTATVTVDGVTYDMARVMVWDSLSGMRPLHTVTDFPQS